jgi:hypothetical protein
MNEHRDLEWRRAALLLRVGVPGAEDGHQRATHDRPRELASIHRVSFVR